MFPVDLWSMFVYSSISIELHVVLHPLKSIVMWHNFIYPIMPLLTHVRRRWYFCNNGVT